MKQLELSDVTRRLAAAHAALRSALAADEPNTTALAAAVASWAVLEQRLRAMSEWPFNTATLRNGRRSPGPGGRRRSPRVR